MASYKQPCAQCGALLDRDARFCSKCGSDSPFVLACPSCLRQITREDNRCPGCGRALRVACPHCGGLTFVQSACEHCGNSLMLRCPRRKCGQPQFFDNKTCVHCGKKLPKIR